MGCAHCEKCGHVLACTPFLQLLSLHTSINILLSSTLQKCISFFLMCWLFRASSLLLHPTLGPRCMLAPNPMTHPFHPAFLLCTIQFHHSQTFEDCLSSIHHHFAKIITVPLMRTGQKLILFSSYFIVGTQHVNTRAFFECSECFVFGFKGTAPTPCSLILLTMRGQSMCNSTRMEELQVHQTHLAWTLKSPLGVHETPPQMVGLVCTLKQTQNSWA